MKENLNDSFTSLDTESKVPYYYQIYKNILDSIQNGKFAIDKKIPNERDLCEKFNVSRTTIRNALKELEVKGMIFRGRGKGTYVKKRFFESHSLQNVSSIVDSLRSEGIQTVVRVLENKIIKSTVNLQEKMEIEPEIPVLKITRLVYVYDEPLYLTKSYFPADIFKEIPNSLITSSSLTKVIEEVYGHKIAHWKRILEPEIPDEKLIKILGIKPNEKKIIHYQETFASIYYRNKKRILFAEEFYKCSKGKFIFEKSVN